MTIRVEPAEDDVLWNMGPLDPGAVGWARAVIPILAGGVVKILHSGFERPVDLDTRKVGVRVASREDHTTKTKEATLTALQHLKGKSMELLFRADVKRVYDYWRHRLHACDKAGQARTSLGYLPEHGLCLAPRRPDAPERLPVPDGALGQDGL